MVIKKVRKIQKLDANNKALKLSSEVGFDDDGAV